MNILKSFVRRRLIIVGLLAGVLAASCVPIRMEASWPAVELIGDEQNILVAYNDRVVMVNPADGTPVKLRNSDGEVRLDQEGNARIWEFRGPEGQLTHFYSAPVQVNENSLLIAAHNRRLFEVDLRTARADRDADGEELPGQVVANPLLTDSLLYVGLNERDLIALQREDRSQQWLFPTNHGVWSEPLIIDDVLYFTSLDHNLYALNAATGEELWQLDLQGAAPEGPVYFGGRLYVGSFARKLFEISPAGEILAEHPTSDWVWSTPTVADGVLYAADLSGMVYALDISDGGFRLLWQAQVSEMAIRTPPVASGEYVIVGSRDQKVYWLSREDGSVFFSRETGGEVLSRMLVIEPGDAEDGEGRLLVVGTPNPQAVLVAYTLQNGSLAWTFSYG